MEMKDAMVVWWTPLSTTWKIIRSDLLQIIPTPERMDLAPLNKEPDTAWLPMRMLPLAKNKHWLMLWTEDLLVLPSMPAVSHSSSTKRVFSPAHAEINWITVWLQSDMEVTAEKNTIPWKTLGEAHGDNPVTSGWPWKEMVMVNAVSN